jgi:hypothetical protein
MQDGFFRGRLAIGFALSALVSSAGLTFMVCAGGGPTPPDAGRYVLNDHGRLTEVTRAVWLAANAAERTMVVGWILMVLFIMALMARKVFHAEDDRGKDHSILVLIAFLLALGLPVLGNLLRPLWL